MQLILLLSLAGMIMWNGDVDVRYEQTALLEAMHHIESVDFVHGGLRGRDSPATR
jgi:hypothetical protein